MLVAGPNDPREVWKLARTIQERFGGPVELDLRYAVDQRFEVSIR